MKTFMDMKGLFLTRKDSKSRPNARITPNFFQVGSSDTPLSQLVQQRGHDPRLRT